MKSIITVASIVILLALAACSSKMPDNLGLKDDQLAPCLESEECVSSQAANELQRVAPIKAHGKPEVVMVDLADAVEAMFGSRIVTIDGNYLHAEYTSPVLRVVDDLECYYDEANGVIQIRSASRTPSTGLNTSRKRIEELRRLFSMMQ